VFGGACPRIKKDRISALITQRAHIETMPIIKKKKFRPVAKVHISGVKAHAPQNNESLT